MRNAHVSYHIPRASRIRSVVLSHAYLAVQWPVESTTSLAVRPTEQPPFQLPPRLLSGTDSKQSLGCFERVLRALEGGVFLWRYLRTATEVDGDLGVG